MNNIEQIKNDLEYHKDRRKHGEMGAPFSISESEIDSILVELEYWKIRCGLAEDRPGMIGDDTEKKRMGRCFGWRR